MRDRIIINDIEDVYAIPVGKSATYESLLFRKVKGATRATIKAYCLVKIAKKRKQIYIGDVKQFSFHGLLQKMREIKDEYENGNVIHVKDNTLKFWIYEYAEHKAAKWTEATRRNFINPLIAHLQEHLDVDVRKLDYPKIVSDVRELLKDERDPKPIPTTAKKICSSLGALMAYLVAVGVITEEQNRFRNMALAFDFPDSEHHLTVHWSKAPEVAKAIINASNLSETAKGFLLFQLHSGFRGAEVSGLRKEYIDIDNRTITIPADRTKQRRLHRIFITPQIEMIINKYQYSDSPFVFSLTGAKLPDDFGTKQLHKIREFQFRLVPHGFRSMMASFMYDHQNHDIHPDWVEAALGHGKRTDIRKAYDKSDYYEQRVPLLKQWNAHIDS